MNNNYCIRGGNGACVIHVFHSWITSFYGGKSFTCLVLAAEILRMIGVVEEDFCFWWVQGNSELWSVKKSFHGSFFPINRPGPLPTVLPQNKWKWCCLLKSLVINKLISQNYISVKLCFFFFPSNWMAYLLCIPCIL